MHWGHLENYNVYFIWATITAQESCCISSANSLSFPVKQLFSSFPQTHQSSHPTPSPFPSHFTDEEKPSLSLHCTNKWVYICPFPFCWLSSYTEKAPRSWLLPPFLRLSFLIFNFSRSTGSFTSLRFCSLQITKKTCNHLPGLLWLHSPATPFSTPLGASVVRNTYTCSLRCLTSTTQPATSLQNCPCC